MKIKFLMAVWAAYLTAAFVFVPQGWTGDSLVIGSTQPYSAGSLGEPAKERGLDDQLRDALAEAPNFQGDFVFEDVYRKKTLDTAIGGNGTTMPMEYRCHSLAQWFFWPEGREQRLENLRGEGDTAWKYVVLIGDPYIMANMPGVYAEGVKLISDEIRKGKAEAILLMPQVDAKPEVLSRIAEVLCRVGQGAGIRLVPAGLVEQTKKQTAGTFDSPNPFAMKYLTTRNVTYNHTGTSSERGITGALVAAIKRCGVVGRKTSPKEGAPKIDFNYGRANSIFEKHKQYKVAPELFARSYGFPMQDHAKTAATTMRYGIDKRYVKGRYDDGTDLGIAYDMILQGEVPADIRCVPIRLMWAKMQAIDPEMKPFRDKWHMSRQLDAASGTFIYALLSGRCPVGLEPPRANQEAWRSWLGQRIGYETAWRMAHLRARVPGFCVLPVTNSDAVSARKPATLNLHFLYPPNSEVSCSISIEPKGAATVQPASLRFRPQNHAAPQTITVTPSTTETAFRVVLQTESRDDVFDGLSDSWSYRVAN